MNTQKSHFILTFVLSICLLTFTGCVAVWGAAHKVVRADENGIAIQYDPMVTSTARALFLAKQHCEKYGKVAEPQNARMPGLLIGIIEETYICNLPE